ncbi:MAG TPA: hypothetical protein VI318_03530 [Baekduia sp.]
MVDPIGRAGVPRWAAPPWTVTLALALAWLAFAPPTPDLAAQVHRVALFADNGFTVWDGSWYGGHHLPDYSLIFPAVADVVGVRVAGVLAVVGSSALFASLLPGRRHAVARRWFALGCLGDLLIGRLTYALGVTAGLASIHALTRGRPRLAVALAVVCAATSPIAGLFLALAGVALAIARRQRWAIAVSAAASATVMALSVAFPEGGSQPFSLGAFAVTAGLSAAGAVAVGRDRVLRVPLALYAAAATACFAVASPMGANVSRLGMSFTGPLLAIALGRAAGPRRVALATLLVAATAWQWVDPITQASRGVDDPSAHAAYYRGLTRELRGIASGTGRVEVPFTRGHWESAYLADAGIVLARGWERQLDRKLNPLFYKKALAPAAYERWLRDDAVRWVALPDAPLDPAGRAEGRLVAAGLPFLREVWHDAHWRLFAVVRPGPLASGPATSARLDADGATVVAGAAGTIVLHVRWTPYWRVTEGAACVRRASGSWTAVEALRPGPIRIAARFSVERAVQATFSAAGPGCDDDAAPHP